MPIIYQEQRNEVEASKKELEAELMRIVNEWENKTGVSVDNIKLITGETDVSGGRTVIMRRDVSLKISL